MPKITRGKALCMFNLCEAAVIVVLLEATVAPPSTTSNRVSYAMLRDGSHSVSCHHCVLVFALGVLALEH